MKTYLALRIKGLLQSWGSHTHEDYRDTYSFPTKSAIVGLIGNAKGLKQCRLQA